MKQPHVLDGDHGLVGEGFEESDLLVSKGTDLTSQDQDRSNGNAFTEQRCSKRRAMAPALLEDLRFRKLGFNLREEVIKVNRLAVGYRSAGYIAPGDRSHFILSEGFQLPK